MTEPYAITCIGERGAIDYNSRNSIGKSLPQKVGSCPARDYCRKYIRHENLETWVFCRVRENVADIKHPIPPHLIGTHYTGYGRDDHCHLDGRSSLSKCSLYKEAVDMGFIKNGKVLCMEEYIKWNEQK